MRNFQLTACIVLFAAFHACFGWVAWAARGDFPVGLLVEFFSAWLAIGAAALAVGTTGAAFYFRRKGRKMRQLPKCVWLVASMALLSVVGAGGTYFGKRTTESEIKEARAYVETMDPLLRTYFAENGRFPETLDSFGVKAPTVHFSPVAYKGYERSFQFTFHEPEQFIDQWEYHSEDRKWLEN
jgi:hypothetical protein